MYKENIQLFHLEKNFCDVKNADGVNKSDELIRGKAIDWRTLKPASEFSKIDNHLKISCKILLKLTCIEITPHSY